MAGGLLVLSAVSLHHRLRDVSIVADRRITTWAAVGASLSARAAVSRAFIGASAKGPDRPQ